MSANATDRDPLPFAKLEAKRANDRATKLEYKCEALQNQIDGLSERLASAERTIADLAADLRAQVEKAGAT